MQIIVKFDDNLEGWRRLRDFSQINLRNASIDKIAQIPEPKPKKRLFKKKETDDKEETEDDIKLE